VLTIPAPRRYAWVSGAAFLLGGVFFLTVGSGPIREVERARSWKPCKAGSECASGLRSSAPGSTVLSRVQYEYRLPDPQVTPQGIRDTGRVYTGTRITFADFALLSDVDHELILAGITLGHRCACTTILGTMERCSRASRPGADANLVDWRASVWWRGLNPDPGPEAETRRHQAVAEARSAGK